MKLIMLIKLIITIMKPSQHGNTKFNYNLLEKYAKQMNLILLNDYSSIKNYITGSTPIRAKCITPTCYNTFNKPFRQLWLKSNLYCKSCTSDIRISKIKKIIIDKTISRNKERTELGIPIPTQIIKPSNRECIHENCKKNPSFNFAGNSTRLYCLSHKLEGMICVVKRPTCIESGCTVFPRYNVRKERIGKYCSLHKLSGMVPVIRTNKHKSCKNDDCLRLISELTNQKYDGYCSRCFKINSFIKEMEMKAIESKEFDALQILINGFQ